MSQVQSTSDAGRLDRLLTLGDIARTYARERPEAIALSFEGRLTTYGEFESRSNQVAHTLLREGLGHGARIAYIGKNCDRYFEILFGAAKVGVVLTPIAWRLAATEVAFILQHCEASILFVGPEMMALARQALSGLHGPIKVIGIDSTGDNEHGASYEHWRAAAPVADVAMTIDAETVALQMYTSGTTGQPKGAMLSHTNLLSGRRKAANAGMKWYDWSSDDISLVALPVAHVGGSVWGLIGLLNGAKGVIAREFDPIKVLDFIEQQGISQIFMVPAALQIVVRQPKARQVNYSRLRCIQYGASPIPLELLRECMDVFGCNFCQQYGMTETSGTIVYLPPEDHTGSGNPRMRAAGLPMPGVELKIVDSDGSALPPYSVGEVVTRSTANMVGYWRMPEASGATIDAEGWLSTGDAGYLDQDGYLYIQDRVKDMIISGGENIYPAEVENAIYGHPDVAEVAVIGVPDEKWGEAVKAIVVRKPGANADPNDIIAFARSRIANFKVPKSVDFIEALPRNPSGKVLRRALREPYWAGRERRVN